MKTYLKIKTLSLLLSACISLLIFNNAFTQNPLVKQLEIKAGLGVLPSFLKDKSENIVPPLNLGIQYDFNQKISLEGNVAHSRSRASKQYLAGNLPYQWKNRLTVIGLKAAAHTRKIEDWDIYGGMLFNYQSSRIEIFREDTVFMQDHLGFKTRSSKISFSAYVGCCYAMSSKIGLYAELGLVASLLNIGIKFNIKKPNDPL